MKHARSFGALVLSLTLWTSFALSQAQTEPAQPNVAPSAPQLPKRVRVSQGVMHAMIVSKVQPSYPKEARKKKIQGPVLMQAVIGTNGDIIDIRLISGHPLLAPAAMEAIKQWKYRPYVLNGTPVEVETTIVFNFTLSGS
jgi:periplasmic protein TonB